METVILCGGFGTRIRDVADDIPKPMIPVGGMPILWHIMKYYAHFGHKDFVLCLGYRGRTVKDFFLNYDVYQNDITFRLGDSASLQHHGEHEETDWKLTLAETGLNAMTGARIKRIQKHLSPGQDFMLTYGDGVGDIDIDKLIAFHKSHGRILTISGVRPPSRFGELESRPDGEVTGFNEKPQTSGGRISGGFFVCRYDIFDYLNDDENLVFEQGPVHALVGDKQVMIFEHDGFWQPMDTYREYTMLNNMVAKGEAPWMVWG